MRGVVTLSAVRPVLTSKQFLNVAPRFLAHVAMASYISHMRTLKNVANTNILQAPVKPQAPAVISLGPGPLTSWVMSGQDEADYNKNMARRGRPGFGSAESTEGVLHRNSGVRAKGTTGATGLFRETVQLAKEVAGAHPGAKLVFVEGGHDAANASHANFFATEPEVPVVAISNGGFSGLWAQDLETQYGQKGFLKVIVLKLQDGESPTAKQVQDLLRANGIENGAPFNITFTSNETSTGVAIPYNDMREILNIPGRKRAIIDASSGLMTQEIPGFGGKKNPDGSYADGVGRRVTVFSTSQKALRGPTDYTLLFISPDDLDVITLESWRQAKIPMPKEIRIDPTELDMGAPKRSSRVAGARELHRALTQMRLMQERGHDHIEAANRTSQFVRDALEESPDFDFFVTNPQLRSSYNMVVVSRNLALSKLSIPNRDAVMVEAQHILADEELATDVKPYGNRGDFRFTTLDIASKHEAEKTLKALSYSVEKAVYLMQSREITLVAEDQFLHQTSAEVETAIKEKAKELSEQGITFIDARKLDVIYDKLPKGTPDNPARYVVYKPDLQGKEIVDEYQKIQACTTSPAIIVAAKTVPAEAKFAVFVREGAGTNNIPKLQAEKDGHIVENCPGLNSAVTARSTLNAIAGHSYIKHFAQAAIQGTASALNLRPLYGEPPSLEKAMLNSVVDGKIVTILGTGDIGMQTLGGLLDSNVKEVRVYSRSLVGKFSQEEWAELVKQDPRLSKLVICNTIAEAMKGAHVAVNHMALVQGEGGTVNAVTKKNIASMADGAVIVDAARAGIINPAALVEAHKSGKLSRVVVDFDTPDKANDGVTKELFDYAKEAGIESGFWFSPHAFADVCPVTRGNMFNSALQQVSHTRRWQVHNFAGTGAIAKNYTDMGKVKPEGILSLGEYLTGLQQKTNPRSKEVCSFVAPALKELYGINAIKISPVQGDGLSNTYIVITDAGHVRFVKIERKSPVPSNTGFSARFSGLARTVANMPFPEIYKTKDQEAFGTIPESLEGREVPGYLKGSVVTVSEFIAKPIAILDTTENTLAKFEALGRYLGNYSKLEAISKKHSDEATASPVQINSIRAMLFECFSLESSKKYLPEELDNVGKIAAKNLDNIKDDNAAASFAVALRNGFLSKVFAELEVLEARLSDIDTALLPHGICNNDISLSNVFLCMGRGGRIEVQSAFDLDNVTTREPLVKDLGRTIAINCFDKETGDLNAEQMMALIRGRASEKPLTIEEAKVLDVYIKLGVMASLGIRTTCMQEMIAGAKPGYEIERSNPELHLKELASLDNYFKVHDLCNQIMSMQVKMHTGHIR